MSLPNADKAVVDLQKLKGYCLNPEHPRGKHKARVFQSALGLSAADAEFLREQLLHAAMESPATVTASDEYGVRYVIDCFIETDAGSATVRSLWIIRSSDDLPRLTTCYVL
ncbi:MAG: DUF6883 domain-containing protein [Pseudomonadota bacterium]